MRLEVTLYVLLTRVVRGGVPFALVAFLTTLALVSMTSCKNTDDKPELVLPRADAELLARTDGGFPQAPGCGKSLPVGVGAPIGTARGRTFRVYTPRGYDKSRAHPVLFVFHGINSSGAQFQSWFKMEEHVLDEPIVVYPDARKTTLGAAWELGGDRDIEFFEDMRSALFQSYCVDLSRVYAMGFSYGGKFVNSLACKRAHMLRAVSSNDASWGYYGEAGCGRVPALVTHRTKDPDELIEWGKASADTWGRIDGCDLPLSTQPADTAHGCADYVGCKSKVTFCEDKFVDPKWPKDWNHTVREEYRDLVWRWLRER